MTEQRRGSTGFFAVLLGRTSTSEADTEGEEPQSQAKRPDMLSHAPNQLTNQLKAVRLSRADSSSRQAKLSDPPRVESTSTGQMKPPLKSALAGSAARMSGASAFEAAVQKAAAGPPVRAKQDGQRRETEDGSSREVRKSVDGRKATPKAPSVDNKKLARNSRKVAFTTPRTSIQQNRDVATSSVPPKGESKVTTRPPDERRPRFEPLKYSAYGASNVKGARVADSDPSSWNASTTTLQNGEPMLLPKKSASARPKGYPSTPNERDDRPPIGKASGPDRPAAASPNRGSLDREFDKRTSTERLPPTRHRPSAPVPMLHDTAERRNEDRQRPRMHPTPHRTPDNPPPDRRERARITSQPDRYRPVDASRASMDKNAAPRSPRKPSAIPPREPAVSGPQYPVNRPRSYQPHRSDRPHRFSNNMIGNPLFAESESRAPVPRSRS